MFSIKDIKTMREKTWVKKHALHGIRIIETQDEDMKLITLHCKKCNEMYLSRLTQAKQPQSGSGGRG